MTMGTFFSIERSHRGITLLELIIYITIMATLLIATSQFAVDMIRGQRRASEVQRVHNAVRRMVALISYDMRQAKSITIASVFDTDNGVLVFTDTTSTTVKYALVGTAFHRQYGAGSSVPVTTNLIKIEKFRVQYLSWAPKELESVRLSFTVSAGLPDTTQFYRQQYSTAVTLR